MDANNQSVITNKQVEERQVSNDKKRGSFLEQSRVKIALYLLLALVICAWLIGKIL